MIHSGFDRGKAAGARGRPPRCAPALSRHALPINANGWGPTSELRVFPKFLRNKLLRKLGCNACVRLRVRLEALKHSHEYRYPAC